jgi:hypothetical protein
MAPPSLWPFALTEPEEAVVALVEQRYKAVCEVLDSATVTDVCA